MNFFNETSEFVNKEIKNLALKFVSRYTKQTTRLVAKITKLPYGEKCKILQIPRKFPEMSCDSTTKKEICVRFANAIYFCTSDCTGKF